MIAYTHKLPALQVVASKMFSKETITEVLAQWKFQNQKIVFTNGCFDILHLGHIDYLAKASDLGHKLIIGLNSDASVKHLGKSTARPLQNQHTRAMILASLHFVNAVIIFDEETPFELIHFLKPSILVKGADYDETITDKTNKKYIVGSDVVKANGGEVKTIAFLEGFSTSAIEQKIKSS